MKTQADVIAKEFKEFAYIVSHDLSAPIRGIIEFSRLLKTEQHDQLSDDGKEYLSLIIESGQKLQSMLVGLLDFSRLNTMSKPFSKVDCNAIISDCLIVLKEKILAAKATVNILPLPTVKADAEQLMQLFLMLLDNALTFHNANMPLHITVSAEQKENEWQFSVRDNGIGIAQEFFSRIFQPFQRLHTDTEYPGIGMGLALAKKIIDRHHGRVWVESADEQGSVFIFALPAKEIS